MRLWVDDLFWILLTSRIHTSGRRNLAQNANAPGWESPRIVPSPVSGSGSGG